MTGRKHVGTPMGSPWLRLLISLLTIGLFLPGSAVGAEDFPPSMPDEPTQWRIPVAETLVDGGELGVASVSNPKLESSLAHLLEAHRREGVGQAQAFAAAHDIVFDGDRVQVVIVTAPEMIDNLKAVVEAFGGERQGHYESLLQALVPIDALDALAGRPDVQRIREPRRPVPLEPAQVGNQTTEGVARSNASAWHTAGYDGTGVKVAVIDGGFTGYTGLLGTDLPASVTTYDWTGSGMGGSSHGTACAEIVHDMAPGATMYLHKISTDVDLGQAVTQAIADGVGVISMSLGWTIDGPGDGTGSLAGMVNSARSNGIFFAVAAGNNANENWAGTYVDYYTGANHYHAWDGSNLWFNFLGAGDGTCYVYVAGAPLAAGLHWDDWSTVNQDYDLHLYRWPGGSTIYRVASSTNSQNGGVGQTPEEYIYTTAAGGNCYAWVVERVSATRDVCLRLATPKMGHLDQWTPQRSLSFPADSPDAITVGAVDVDSPYPLESYSSQGPTFGSGGACSGGSTKPDIAAYANVSTVSYGAGGFNGTSAATPHVGGAAVLVKDAYPSYTVAQMQSYLESSAMDLGTSGKDNLYGSGRLYLGSPPAGTGPTVTSITPNSGLNNGTVSITNLAGSNFQSGATVKLTKSGQPNINGTSVSVVSSSRITCDFNLTGATTGQWNVVVTNPDSQSGTLPNGFTVNAPSAAPTVASITPNSGLNNDTVSITNLAGSNFQSGATVKLTKSGQPDINATNVVVVSSSKITCDFNLTGATTGQWNVVVTNPDSQSGTLPNGFTVNASGDEDFFAYLPFIWNRWPPLPETPVLNAISNPDGNGNYTVSWGAADLAETYVLQEDDNSSFSSPARRYSGSGTSWYASGKGTGTYYYRVIAKNSWGSSDWSNVESVQVSPPTKLYAVADATVLSGAPGTNFGSAGDMWVGYDLCYGGKTSRSLIRFDVSDIPAGTSISQAKLYLRHVNSCYRNAGSYLVTTYRATNSWSSSSVTWNNQPGYGESYGSASVSSSPGSWYSFDVTNLVRGWVNGSVSNYGIVLRASESSSTGIRLGFATVNSSYDPYLQITYTGVAASAEAVPAVEQVPYPTACGPTVKDVLGFLPGASDCGPFECVEQTVCSPD
jgi:hypothetical protein